MTEKWKEEAWAQEHVVERPNHPPQFRRLGGGASAHMLVPAPWRAAFGAEKASRSLRTTLSGAGAAGGKTAVVGLEMAADRINKNGGIGAGRRTHHRRDESKPMSDRRKCKRW